MCENVYDVQYSLPDETIGIKEMKISKTLNLNNCTKKPAYVFTSVPGVRCVNKNCKTIDEVGPIKKTYLIPTKIFRATELKSSLFLF